MSHETRPMSARARTLLALAVFALLWTASLALPALRVRSGPMLDGVDLLLRGWQGVSRGVVAWYANPLFIAALATAALGRSIAAAVLALLALALALTSFVLEPVLRMSMNRVPEVTLLGGVYVWLAAMLGLAFFTCAMAYRGHSRHGPKLDNKRSNRD
jgi:hypothetical protein